MTVTQFQSAAQMVHGISPGARETPNSVVASPANFDPSAYCTCSACCVVREKRQRFSRSVENSPLIGELLTRVLRRVEADFVVCYSELSSRTDALALSLCVRHDHAD